MKYFGQNDIFHPKQSVWPNFRFGPKVRFFKCRYFGFGVSAKKLFRLTTKGEAGRQRQGQAGVPGDARRIGVVQRGDWGGGEQRRHQDEH